MKIPFPDAERGIEPGIHATTHEPIRGHQNPLDQAVGGNALFRIG